MRGSDLEAAGRDKSPVQIRDCRGDEFESALELLMQLWPGTEIDQGAIRQVFQRLLESNDCHVLCAVAAGRMVGFCDFFVRYSQWCWQTWRRASCPFACTGSRPRRPGRAPDDYVRFRHALNAFTRSMASTGPNAHSRMRSQADAVGPRVLKAFCMNGT